MNWMDFVNGTFESLGGFFILLSVVKLYHDKRVRGVSWIHAAFFSSWGYWNLAYYPHLGQWMSFIGGAFLVAVNTVWLLQMLYYLRVERIVEAEPDRIISGLQPALRQLREPPDGPFEGF